METSVGGDVRHRDLLWCMGGGSAGRAAWRLKWFAHVQGVVVAEEDARDGVRQRQMAHCNVKVT